jgi:serine/threonine protein kinase
MGSGSPGDACVRCLLTLGVANDPERNESTDLAFLLADPRPPDAVKFFSFGDFELLEEIARGGMGVVFRARQKSLERIVALKFIRRDVLSSSSGLRRFRLEAKTAASLSHPNIVPIYGFGEQDGHHYVTMEFMKENLTDQLAKRDGAAPDFPTIGQAVSAIAKIAGAVHYAHGKGVLHRDIKPANILVDQHGEPRLTDFGLAKILDEVGGLTVKDEVLGTPSYISPEQGQGKNALTPATDVYALGATLYELVTDKPPFEGRTKLDTLKMVLESMPTRPRDLNKSIPPILEIILGACLAKRPTERYATAEQLATDLNWFLDNRSALQNETEEAVDLATVTDLTDVLQHRPQVPPTLRRNAALYLAAWNPGWNQTAPGGPEPAPRASSQAAQKANFAARKNDGNPSPTKLAQGIAQPVKFFALTIVCIVLLAIIVTSLRSCTGPGS